MEKLTLNDIPPFQPKHEQSSWRSHKDSLTPSPKTRRKLRRAASEIRSLNLRRTKSEEAIVNVHPLHSHAPAPLGFEYTNPLTNKEPQPRNKTLTPSTSSSSTSSSGAEGDPLCPLPSNDRLTGDSAVFPSPQKRYSVKFKENQEKSEATAPSRLTWSEFLTESSTKVAFAFDKNNQRYLQAASFDILIHYLVADPIPFNQSFVDTMLLTHTAYMSAFEFLDKLLKLFEKESDSFEIETSKQVERARVINVIRKWIEFGDIRDEAKLLLQLRHFGSTLAISEDSMEHSWGISILEILEEMQKQWKILGEAKFLSKVRRSKSFRRSILVEDHTFADIDPGELARHIASQDWKLFARIKSCELIHKAWTRPDKDVLAPNVTQMIHNFNKTSNWISSEILIASNKTKHQILERCIELANELKAVKDFHSMWATVAALMNHNISRLPCWKSISRRHQSMWEEVKECINSRSNFKTYRDIIKTLEPPLIPFEGIMLSDLTYVDESPDMLDQNINYGKMEVIANILKSLKELQQVAFDELYEDDRIQSFMDKATILSEDMMKEYALRANPNADKRLRKSQTFNSEASWRRSLQD